MLIRAHLYKQVVFFSMMMLYVLYSMKGNLPILSYNLNYKYISTVLCENKDNKLLACNGKCILQKDLKETSDDHHTESRTSVKTLFPIELPSEIFSLTLNNYFSEEERYLLFFRNDYSYLYGYSIFAPPEV